MEEDEVAIPCPGSWSDSDDEVEVGVNGTATSGGYAPSQALALLATAPGHDHRQRNLAGAATWIAPRVARKRRKIVYWARGGLGHHALTNATVDKPPASEPSRSTQRTWDARAWAPWHRQKRATPNCAWVRGGTTAYGSLGRTGRLAHRVVMADSELGGEPWWMHVDMAWPARREAPWRWLHAI